MTGQNPNPGPRSSISSDDSAFLVNTSPSLETPSTASRDGFEHLSSSTITSTSSNDKIRNGGKAKLIYCKSHVAIHPTPFNKDNISGYLAIVEVDGDGKKEVLITWVPDELLDRMDKEDREGYIRVEGRSTQHISDKEKEEDGFVFVSLPPPKGEKYAFSVPITGIYSVLVYPPSLTHWYGSATFNLMGGVSLPTLYFHDDESPLVSPTTPSTPQQSIPRAQWGFPPFLSLIQARATLVRSRLLQARRNLGAELWLVNPSKSDREVHESGVDEPEPETVSTQRQAQAKATPAPYPPKPTYPNASVLSQTTPKQTLFSSLSNITNLSRKTASQILSHPLAQPVVPHLPPAVRSLVHVPGEWERSGAPTKNGKGNEVATEFESARLYLARWARVVAEEGEKARRDELAAQARIRRGSISGSSISEDLSSSLGVFSMLPRSYSKRPIPNPTRTPQHPITSRDWDSFAAQGRDEYYVRREIFRRGFTDSPEPVEKRARREGWEMLLGIVPWHIGGLGGGECGRAKRIKARQESRDAQRKVYVGLRSKWKMESTKEKRDEWREEWHRIDVDCRRTDRNQTIYAVPAEMAGKNDHEKEAGGAHNSWDERNDHEEGAMAGLNPHIAALRTILMTYHTYSPELGYVQGMSDLLSPIYVVFDANEGDAFWGLVGVMKMMESNFLRDQSGMKRQLSTLQQLIGVMDPELYAHLERTDSLNLFFCFRWILIAFKREFKFENVIKLWEVLWTNIYSDHFVLFVALAILQSHRDNIIRYLAQFDEVLKYTNDLSGTIDLDTTLAQAEVLFLSFKSLVEDLDKENGTKTKTSDSDGEGLRRRRASALNSEQEKAKEKKKVVSGDLRGLLDGWKAGNESV